MSLKSVFFICFTLLFSVHLLSQNSSKELGIITENDIYTSSKNDQYYTNGLEIFYRYLSKKTKPNVLKKINEIHIGQYMYSPRTIYVDEEDVFDRPFAGYLFGEFGNTNFYKNQSVFKKYLQLGYIGPNSFADKVQSETHILFHYKAFEQWDYQIQNALAIQTYFMFSRPFLNSFNKERIDFQWQTEAKLGTIFTSLTTGFVARIGIKKLMPLSESNFHGASISAGANKEARELYFYMAPSINYQIYDATIQGSMFNDKSPVTFDLIPLRFNGEAGFRYRKNNWNLSYAFVYRGKELKFYRTIGYFYGSIRLSYIFR
ncbi:lipid A deacylase LpxR family protein [Flavobacterium flavipallidum]|uniref:Lipid A deacylase LpxR family protein n=1 Tax=Flavobacterium flavipallidum TaxID=3139140 RepID=A0ABU9HPA4_9FLAO